MSVDAMDVSGEQQIDVDHDVFKQRLDLDGNVIEATPQKEGIYILYIYICLCRSNEWDLSLSFFILR